MADRYWILGTGTWDSTSTTNWSASSGGAGGASVPTKFDNVFFDVNSNVGTGAFTVTMATTPRVCNDFTASGLDGVMTLAGSGIGLTVSSSLTFPATNFTRTYTGTTTFNATTTGKTVTTNGVAFGGAVIFNDVSGGWTLGSALTSSSTITVTAGTVDTSSSSNYSITASTLSSSNSNTRTINLNASTVTVTGQPITFTTSTGLTFNAGTSQINCGGTVFTFNGGSKTFYNVAFTSGGLELASITGTNVFNNLTITGRTNIGYGAIVLYGNQTINGALTVNAGTASAYRLGIVSSVNGTTRTLTCTNVFVTDTDFRDINCTISGFTTGSRVGDCGGNSGGLLFAAPRTHYFALTGSADWGTTGAGSWSSTSGGAANATRFPLPQDTAIFPASTYPASGSIVTINSAYNLSTIDMSLRTANTLTLDITGSAFGFNSIVCGNWINGTGTNFFSGTNTITFTGRTTQTITSAGKTFVQPIIIDSVTGSVILQDNLTVDTTLSTTFTSGTLSLQSYKFETPTFLGSNSNARTIAFGTGNITCSGTGTVWNTATATNLTTTGTQVVNVTSTATTPTTISVFSGVLSEANSISFNFTGGTYELSFLASSNYSARNIDFTGYAGTLGTTGVNATIYGNLKFSTGMTLSASAYSWRFGATSGTRQITTNAKILDFALNFSGVGGTFQLQDAVTMGSTRIAQLTDGTLDLNGKTLTVGSTFQTAAGTKNLTFNGGTLVCPAATTTAFNNAQPTGFTTTAGTGTGTISMTAATAKSFVGGGSTFNCTLSQGGAGALTITDSNTFGNIANTVQPASVLFTAATTNTFSNFSLSGTAGNLVTIGSVTAASHTLSKSSGTVSSDFLSISRSTAAGGAVWNAGANSTDGGNNSGWVFTAPPATATGNFLQFF
jgi:hypothetical protein